MYTSTITVAFWNALSVQLNIYILKSYSDKDKIEPEHERIELN